MSSSGSPTEDKKVPDSTPHLWILSGVIEILLESGLAVGVRISSARVWANIEPNTKMSVLARTAMRIDNLVIRSVLTSAKDS